MYADFYGFNRKPFNVTPDPDFIYYSEQHKEALAHMLYGVQERRGFILVTGRVGSGKTTLCRAFMRELDDKTSTALILNSKMEPTELLMTIAEDFGIDLDEDPTQKDVLDALKDFVLNEYENGRNACVIIDEAQNLSPDALEQIRLLSNLETEKEKLLQIVLSGQPELETMLNREELRQLKQRIAVKSYLSNLDEEETRQYVQHRLALAAEGEPHIDIKDDVYPALYEATGGNPRAINLVGDRTLMAAFIDESPTVQLKHLEKAIEDLADHVPETEDRNSIVLHRLLDENRVTRAKIKSFLGSLLDAARHPVVLGLVATVATVALGWLGLSMTNGLTGSPIVQGPPEEKLTEPPSSAVSDTRVTQPSDTSAGSPESKLADATNVGDTEEEADTERVADTASNETSPETDADASDAESSTQPEEEPTSDESSPDSEATEEPSPDGDVFTASSYLEPQSIPDESYRNPLSVGTMQVEGLDDNALNKTLLISIARYLSYYVAKNDVPMDELGRDSIDRIGENVSGETILGDVLSVQALPVNGNRRQLLRYEQPAFLRIQGRDFRRYVLYLPEENTLWDPVNGWIENPGVFVPSSWNGFAFVLAQAPFDMTRIMEFDLEGPRVLELQKLLNGAGDYNIPRVDRYGPKTQSSVRDFQQRAELPVDGVAGTHTYLALLKANNRGIEISVDELRTLLDALEGGDESVADQGSSGQGSGENDWNVF